MLAFRIASGVDSPAESTEAAEQDSDTIRLPKSIVALVGQGKAKASLEEDLAWLSFYDLDGKQADEIRDLILSFAKAINDAGLSLAPGCAKCKVLEGVQLFFHEGQCSRLCQSCVAKMFQDQHAAQRRLDSARLRYAFLLPPAMLGVAVGWAIFFCVVDLLIRWLDIKVIVIPGGMGILALLALFVTCGLAFSYPLGRSIGRLPFARILGPTITILGCIAGELLYVAVTIYLRTGVFDFALAVQIFPRWVSAYARFWAVGKLLLCGAVILGTYVWSNNPARNKAPLKL
jgi:hypothetical protein